MIFHPGSSSTCSLQGTRPSLPPVRIWCRLVGSPKRALWLPSRSTRTRRASRWGYRAALQLCKTLRVFNSWPPCLMGICGRSSCRYVWGVPWSTLWRTLCTHYLTWTGMGCRWPWPAGFWGPRRRSCNCHTDVSVLCIRGGLSSPMLAPPMMVRVPFVQVREGGRRRFQILVHIFRVGGWGRGSRSGLRRGHTRWTPRSPSGVDGYPWWRRIPAYRSAWGVRGREPLHCSFDRCGGWNGFNANCWGDREPLRCYKAKEGLL